MKFAFIFGTRPEILKLYSLIKLANNKGIKTILIHTNQHYSEEMDSIFFKELDLPTPQYNLKVGSAPANKQISQMVEKIGDVLESEKPDVVLVQGDTNSTFSGALAANKLNIKVAHIEAGLRSYDREMPEEINRILTDNLSDFLFPVTQTQYDILKNDNINLANCIITGNTIVDCLYDIKEKAQLRSSRILNEYNLQDLPFYFLTLHRPSNVDNKESLITIIENIEKVANEQKVQVVFPAHPRTLARIKEFNIEVPDLINIIPPTSYSDCVGFMLLSKLILTDSGGIQEEACILKKPCLTIRENTERPETLEVKANILVGNSYEKLKEGIRYFSENSSSWENPFGDGKTADRIISLISSKLESTNC